MDEFIKSEIDNFKRWKSRDPEPKPEPKQEQTPISKPEQTPVEPPSFENGVEIIQLPRRKKQVDKPTVERPRSDPVPIPKPQPRDDEFDSWLREAKTQKPISIRQSQPPTPTQKKVKTSIFG